jgi:uncharacterized paraquat-inducible protein A
MSQSGFYSDTKYCPKCDTYVRYLQSVQSCYCVECGSKVSLFSRSDRKAFLNGIKAAKAARKGDQKRVS